jgi:histidinol-phosphate phosphatase family protein
MLTDQAVILCGGRGTRLRPITDTMPKPMVPVCGRPFLEHLLRQLLGQGIAEVVLLTGYLGDIIEGHFGDGSSLGIKISYSRGPEEWDTGRRLWEARHLLKEHFFLLYGDNYANFDAKRVEEMFLRHGRLGCLSLHAREKNANIRFSADGVVDAYDRSRTSSGLNAVEIGYMLLSSRVFEFYSQPDCSFSGILESLALKGQLAAHLVGDVYYSVSDPERLKITEQYLTPKKILLIDRDGTINEKAPRGEYITRWEDFRFIGATVNGMKQLAAQGWCFIVISNQAGVGRGVMTAEQVWEIDRKMVEALALDGITILRSYYCLHHWTEECSCRKPRPGMLFQASKDFLLPLYRAWYIGDDPRDCTAAWLAGCNAAYLGELRELESLPADQRPQLVLHELSEMLQSLNS